MVDTSKAQYVIETEHLWVSTYSDIHTLFEASTLCMCPLDTLRYTCLVAKAAHAEGDSVDLTSRLVEAVEFPRPVVALVQPETNSNPARTPDTLAGQGTEPTQSVC